MNDNTPIPPAEPSHEARKKRVLSPAGWAGVIILGALLGAACWYAVRAWFLVPDQMTDSGYVALALGIVFSVVLGAGLMALVFWSNRKGFDR